MIYGKDTPSRDNPRVAFQEKIEPALYVQDPAQDYDKQCS